MKSHELAMAVSEVHLEARARIYTTGHEQYSGGTGILTEQRFEKETVQDSLDGLEEELLDVINWAAMTILKVREVREKANRTLTGAGDTTEEFSRACRQRGEDPEPVVTPEPRGAHRVPSDYFDRTHTQRPT
jgi:hypothetical protein